VNHPAPSPVRRQLLNTLALRPDTGSMATQPRKRRPQPRHVIELLALLSSSPHGATEALLVRAHGFSSDMISGSSARACDRRTGNHESWRQVGRDRPRRSLDDAGGRSKSDASQGRNHPSSDQVANGLIIALSADKVRGVRNSEIVWSVAATLSAAARPYSLRRERRRVCGCSTSPGRRTRMRAVNVRRRACVGLRVPLLGNWA